MMQWYNNHNTVSQELQRLREQYGSKYPDSWKHVLNWNGWKDARKVYLEHVQQASTSSTTNGATSSSSTATATTTNGETTNDVTNKPKRKSRWGSVSTTATTTTSNGVASANSTSTADGTTRSGCNIDSSNEGKRGRWGTAPEASVTEMVTNHTNHNGESNSNPSELEQLRLQLRALNYKIDHVAEEANRIDALPHDHRERSVSPPPSYVYSNFSYL